MPLKAKNPISVLDVYKWLPPYGENEIHLISNGSYLNVQIYYDSVDNEQDEYLTLKFNNVCFFKFSSFPGVDISNIKYEKFEEFTDLVHYKKSDLADAWSKHFNLSEQYKHYRIAFIAENKVLEVIAFDFILDDNK